MTIEYPKISVVMPSYNQGQFIEDAILSVLGQGYPDLELIVMDGGSTDGTVEVLKKYSRRLTYWQSAKDKGQADAINQGMARSTGKIVCWLNSDDMYLPGALLDIGRRFAENRNFRLVYGAAVTIFQNDPVLNASEQVPLPFDAARLTYFDYIIQPSSFWTRELWDAVGGLEIDQHYVLDWAFYIKASKLTPFEYVPKFYSVYRRHPQHKSGQGKVERRQEILGVVRKYAEPYWGELYCLAGKHYAGIRSVLKLLNRLRIPYPVKFVPLLMPFLALKLRRWGDLDIVMEMYRQ